VECERFCDVIEVGCLHSFGLDDIVLIDIIVRG
jgi:hypothetical protein